MRTAGVPRRGLRLRPTNSTQGVVGRRGARRGQGQCRAEKGPGAQPEGPRPHRPGLSLRFPLSRAGPQAARITLSIVRGVLSWAFPSSFSSGQLFSLRECIRFLYSCKIMLPQTLRDLKKHNFIILQFCGSKV